MNSWEFYSRIEMFKHTQKDDELAHYGIAGQKWGTRRWQYADGRFNPEGKERYFGSKGNKEKSSDTGVKDYIKYKNESSDQKQKFGSTYFWNDNTRRVHNDSYQNADGSLTKKGEKLLAKSQNGNEKAANKIKAKALIDMDMYNEYNKENSKNVDEIYKKYEPKEWRRFLNTSDLSTEDKIKIENELNKKLYKEDKNYANIVNNEDVKNALKEYIDVRNDVIKESNRIFSKEFMDNNPEAKDWSGDGTEYWHKFADKDISNKDIESYWKLRETVSSLSRKHGKWDNDMFDKVLSDLTEPVEDITDDSSKAYDKLKEHIGVDFREPSQKFGSAWDNSEVQKEAFRQIKEIEKNNKDGKNYIYKVDVDDDGKVKVSIDKEASGNTDSFTENMNDMFGLDIKNPNEGSTSYLSPKEEKALQKEADKIDKAFAKGDIGTLNLLQSDKTEQIRKEANESFNKNCSEELNKLKDLYKDYDDNSEYYYALTALANSLVFGNTKVGTMANMIHGYVYDDFDQGSGSSGHVYLLDKGYTKDDMTNMCKTNSENNEKFKNDIDLSISKDPLMSKTNERVKIQLRNALHNGSKSNLINKDANDYNDYSYRLQESGDTNADYSNRIKQNLPEAKKILNKVNKTCSNKEYGWWYLNKAIDELGYSNIDYKDLTDSDWNKINAKIKELG